jgi:uncharacterized protein YPO0396
MQKQLDFAESDTQAGFRLQRFEVLNWGTFHKQIWALPPEGHNSLLTGDIGSGKSTLIDALTTLLIAPRRIVYNKAAGADTRERSLRSYVRGYFKSEKDAESLSAKAVALRGDDSYSVLLANFVNPGFRQAVTLAQVFGHRDHRNPPDRFYVVAAEALSIADTFADFGGDLLALKKRLRKTRGIKLFESYAQYVVQLRRHLGIDNPQALDLLYQTVSMKSVGNLTDFVRQHMLEEPPVQQRIDKICHHFDDLNRAHEAVLKARRQVEALEPIAAEAGQYRAVEAAMAALRQQRSALHAYFADQKIRLLTTRIGKREQALARVAAQIAECDADLARMHQRQRELERSIQDSGGRRLEELAAQIERLTQDRRRIADKAERYRKYCRDLKMTMPHDEAGFVDTRRRLAEHKTKIAQQRADSINQQVEQKVDLRTLSDKMADLEREIESLQARETNIPRKNLKLRQDLCRATGIDESKLPFAGELLHVRETEARWEGVIERLLHGFGLSLLVPQSHYAAVAAYAEATHLEGRLVYFKTSKTGTDTVVAPAPEMLTAKLEIKPDTSFYDWLERELHRRFRYICCTSLDEFRRRTNAVTAAGQIKTANRRHEKDDRFRIDDRRRYVLGWQNKEKIRSLQSGLDRLEAERLAIVEALQQIDSRLRQADAVNERLQVLLTYETYAEIHWQVLAQQVERLNEEKQRIETSNDVLRTLQSQLDSVQEELQEKGARRDKMLAHQGKVQEGLDQDRRRHADAAAILAALDETQRQALFPQLAVLQPEALEQKRVTVENCDNSQTRMREWLQRQLDNEVEKSKRSAQHITRNMQQYKGLYPVETREVDASVDAIDAFVDMLATLKSEDLPRHEQRFKTMLNEGTIQNMALFQAKLDKELHDIRDKIDTINRSLGSIDYNDGTFIRLVTDPSRDVDIRQFREDLRACLGETLAGSQDDAYTENKFLQVKALIDRFNGREGQADFDRRWTRKVTDVRHWLAFSVSERWREDEKEKEYYSDTAGKSGGQKEKLAYTILAAALAYQFGLKWNETRSRSFRFVMIDEAFGRGSDESTRYALELFRRLNLQLLIVTPLQKINIIEDYVSAVHYIHNPDGKNSMVRNLTIEQYREEKAAFAESAA